MKINKQNGYKPFKAKHPDIRLADDIMRKSKLDFPCLSSTYIRDCYSILNPEYKNFNKVVEIVNYLACKIAIHLRGWNENKIVGAEILDKLKQYKIGNCYEKAVALTAELSRYGFKSVPVYLALKTFLVDSKNKVINKKFFDIDHVAVVTVMNNEKRKADKKIIVVDSWMGFTAEKEEAKEKYRTLFAKKIKCRLEDAKCFYERHNSIKDTRIKYDFDFFDSKITDEQLEEIIHYFKK